MMQNFSRKSAKGVAQVLNAFLRTDANSAACCIMHQPKAPKELSKFRRTK